jgi:hypothetical protein
MMESSGQVIRRGAIAAWKPMKEAYRAAGPPANAPFGHAPLRPWQPVVGRLSASSGAVTD